MEAADFRIKEMESVIATVTGYHDAERFDLIKLIDHSGANYVGRMYKGVTHLICRKFEGRKYKFAKKLKIIIVNHRWIEECVKKGRRVSEAPYTVLSGEDVGPLEIPLGINLDQIIEQKKFKKPVINIESDDMDVAARTETILLNEIGEPSTSQRRHSRRLKKREFPSPEHSRKTRKLVKKQLGMNNSLFTSKVERECQDKDVLPQNNSHEVLCGSPDVEILQKPSDMRFFMVEQDKSDALHEVEVTEDVNDENPNSCVHVAASSFHTISEEPFEVTHEDFTDIDNGNRLPASKDLSCVICWTDFSSSRGVLPCGHRFCFSCIQDWSNHKVSQSKPPTCPLCKAVFTFITKVDDAISSDQKVYSQTVPHDGSKMEVHLVAGEARQLPSNPSEQVCCQCSSREPEDLLERCNSCNIRCIHIYCLDPPLFPWTCVLCKDLQMLYHHIR